jgi:hypothetical protein
MSDWWAERLGGRQTATQAPQARYPQQQQPPPNQWYPEQGQPQQYQQPQPQFQQQQPQGPPRVTLGNLMDAVASWKGGPGARGSARCPECGSPNFFNRGNENAPQCYECGANPRFAPQGQPRG